MGLHAFAEHADTKFNLWGVSGDVGIHAFAKNTDTKINLWGSQGTWGSTHLPNTLMQKSIYGGLRVHGDPRISRKY